MTNNLTPAPHRRRRIIVIATAAVAAVGLGLVIGLIVVGTSRHNAAGEQPTSPGPVTAAPTSAAASSPPPSPTSASTPRSVDGVSGSLADGCLGGADAFTAILTAQRAATPDNNGAAAFARTVARWSASYPSDPNAPNVLTKLQAPGSAFADAALVITRKANAALQSQGYVSAQILPNLGQYRVLAGVTGGAAGSDDGAIIQIQLYRQLTNTAGQSSQMQLTTELSLRLAEGTWTVVGSPPTQQNPSSAAIAWQPFSGAC